MSNYVSPNTSEEFIQRTFEIVKQYKTLENTLCEKYYDTTLLLNCLLGLVVLPREHTLNKLPKVDLPQNLQGTIQSCKLNDASYTPSFNEYIEGLRNAIVHWGQQNSLMFEKDSSNKIYSVTLESSFGRIYKIKYQFQVNKGNELEAAIQAILAFCYPNLL